MRKEQGSGAGIWRNGHGIIWKKEWHCRILLLIVIMLVFTSAAVYGQETVSDNITLIKESAEKTDDEIVAPSVTKEAENLLDEQAEQRAGSRIISVPTMKPENIMIRDIKAGTILPEKVIEEMGEDDFFYVEEITDETFERMWKKSFKENCTTPREDLRYIRCLHCDIDGNIKIGELVMHKCVADTVCEIFRKLFVARYPIESMILVDEFDASDEESIMADNTSAFNFRMIDSTDQISNHAYGLAIDINPYYNVYYIPSANYVFPPEGWEYLDREADFPYKLVPGDLCYNLFTEAGFNWGGWWTYNTDYQHFEYVIY